MLISGVRMLPDQPPDSSSPTEDSSLHCLNCGYNLTGLTENRCPECGEAFDLDTLRRIAAGEPMPATPWDVGQSLSRFLDTWGLALLQPRQLARQFPPCHDVSNATAYSCFSYVCAGAAFILLTLLAGDPDFARASVSVTLGAIFACWICETALAGLLALLARPARVPRRYHFWRGLTHYTSTYAIFTGIWGGVVLSCVDVLLNDTVAFALMSSAVLIFVWWAAALCVMVASRSDPGARRVFACVAVPIVGFGAILLGIAATYAFAFLCLAH